MALLRRYGPNLFVLVAVWLFFAFDFGTTHSWIFQERDLNRALDLVNGHWIAYGPETTGGGYLFGPLYYIILAIPRLLGSPFTGAWYEMLVLLACASLILWWFLKRTVNSTAGAFAVTFFVLSIWERRLFVTFCNPSFLPIFLACTVVFLSLTFIRTKANPRAWFFALFTIGLGCQIHASILIMIASGIALQILAPRLKLARLTAGQFAVGFLGLLVPLLPYIIWRIGSGALSGAEQGPDGSSLDALRAMAVIVGTPGAQALISFYHFVNFLIAQFPFALFVLIPAVYLSRRFFIRAENPAPDVDQSEGEKLLKIAAVLCLTTAPLILYQTFASNAYRYVGPFAISVSVLSALITEKIFRIEKRIWIFTGLGFLWGIILILVTRNSSLALERSLTLTGFALCLSIPVFIEYGFSRRRLALLFALVATAILHEGQSRYFWRMHETTASIKRPWLIGDWDQYYAISSVIYRQTGWNFEEARKRIFYVNPFLEHAMAYAYEAAAQSIGPVEPPPNPPSGFLAATIIGSKINRSRGAIEKWLQAQNLPGDVHAWLANGQMKLGEPAEFQQDFLRKRYTMLIPYYFPVSNEVPVAIQNIGFQYMKYPEAPLLEGFTEHRGVDRLANGEIVFHWNECPGHQPSCTTGAIVNVSSIKPRLYRIGVKIVGQPLSHLSQWITPRWTECWNEPYVEFQCDGETIHYRLAESVGWDQKYAQKTYGNIYLEVNSILAPFERVLNIECAKGLKQIRVGRKNSTIIDTNLYDPLEIHPPELSVQL